jgi:hypothetical protein
MAGKVEGVHIVVVAEQLAQWCQLGTAAQGAVQED